MSLVGGAAVGWPLMARAQQPDMPVIGFLRSTSFDSSKSLLVAFREGLNETGYVEGKNVAISFRWAEGHNERLASLAAELINLPAALIVCNVPAASAAMAATKTVPIVFAAGTDPIANGFVTSLSRPGGNVTGVTFLGNSLGPKQLELLHELLPTAKKIAVLVDTPSFLNQATRGPELKSIEDAAHALGQDLFVLEIGSEGDFEAVSGTLAQQRADALLSLGGAFFLSQRDQVIALAARHNIPAIYHLVEYVEAGGLMSYGASLTDAYRLVGVYAGKILNGAKPGDLPVQESTKVELVLNLKTAKALGITFPQSLLIQADEVIE